jgi:hypothetical protein
MVRPDPNSCDAREEEAYGMPRPLTQRARHKCLPDGYFSAPINAFTASNDGQQQPSTPLFGSGAWPLMPIRSLMPISTRQPVIGAAPNKSMSLTIIDREKTSVFAAFGLGGERSSDGDALLALSEIFAGGAVKRRLLSGWSFQQWLEPCP